MQENQYGFRNRRGCTDYLHVLRAAINYAIENEEIIELSLIDFTQAFDTVSHEFLPTVLKEHYIPDHIIDLIMTIYKDAEGVIKGANGCKSKPFNIRRGVLQGCILSPILFIMCLNSVWNRISKERGEKPNSQWIIDQLTYADDLTIFNKYEKYDKLPDLLKIVNDNVKVSEERIENFNNMAKNTVTLRININKCESIVIAPKENIKLKLTQTEIDKHCKCWCNICGYGFADQSGLKIHNGRCNNNKNKKDKLRSINSQRNTKAYTKAYIERHKEEMNKINKIKIQNQEIQRNNTFKILGAKTTGYSNNDEIEVEARIDKASQAFKSLNNIWFDKRLLLDVKVRLFKIYILSILTYGAESWRITREMLTSLRGFVQVCFTTINHKAYSGTNNDEFWEKTNVKIRFEDAMKNVDILDILDKRRWKWLGHTLRMKMNRNIHRALTWLKFDNPGSLLAHLPKQSHDIKFRFQNAINLAVDTKQWENMLKENKYNSLKSLFNL
jgi:hypothetical protein